jgi:hypothetical protein
MKLGDAIQTQTDLTVGAQILQRLTAELERRGITAEEIGRLSRISMWQGLTKMNKARPGPRPLRLPTSAVVGCRA